jgi:hypothetical protein
MANPTLHWRMLPPVFVANPTNPATFLDALYQMGTSTVYADGALRSPGAYAAPNIGQVPLVAGPTSLGTGSAWTWNYDATTFATGAKTCVYAYPPTSAGAINQAVVIGSTSSFSTTAGAWKQLSTDTRIVNCLYAGQAKNSGLYTSWNSATTPFTVGDFTGMGYLSAATSLYAYIIMWECEESIMVQVVAPSTGNISMGVAGAFIDPLSVNTSSAETDGRLYGISVTGNGNYMGTAWLSTATPSTAPLFYHSGTSGDMHSVTFTPGAGTLVNTYRFGTFTPSNQFTSRSGDLPQIPMQLWNLTQYVGQLRQIFITRDTVTGIEWQAGATPKGYLVSASPSTACDAVILTY